MKNVIWQGIVDNLELSGYRKGDEQPMRVIEQNERLMTEFAFSKFADNGAAEIEYTDEWIADSSMRFRDMDPQPSDELRARMISEGLICC